MAEQLAMQTQENPGAVDDGANASVADTLAVAPARRITGPDSRLIAGAAGVASFLWAGFAAVVFAREVDLRTRDDARVAGLDARIAEAHGAERQRLRGERDLLWAEVRSEQLGRLADAQEGHRRAPTSASDMATGYARPGRHRRGDRQWRSR